VSTHLLGGPAAAAEAAAEVTWSRHKDDGPYHVSLLVYHAFYAAGEAISERNAQCRLLGDVVGNPFRPVSLAPAWLTPAVRNLAQAAYDNRLLPSGLLDNTGLAIL